MKKYIHVNQFAIRANKKHGKKDPVISVKTYKENKYGHEVEIKGPCRLVYRPDKPLSCGAQVYLIIEDDVEIEIIGETAAPKKICKV